MKRVIIFATAYPYAAGTIAIIWLSSAVLLMADDQLSFSLVLWLNAVSSLVIAAVGFRR